jgi:tetratricopeptide (TPR) repeat protein
VERKWATLTAVLGIIALTIWAAVASAVFKDPLGLLAGATLTALASVAAGYVPGITDAVRRRHAELARLEAEETANQEALRRASELPPTGPAGLLDPRRGLVRFIGRERELAELLTWCQDVRPRGVRLVTGPGGVGKTRLSVELCARLDQDQWRWVRVGDREEASVLATARRGWSGPLLLVVDYAETRIGLPDMLRAVAADAGPVRVLLLARSAGEWRERLAAAEPAVRELLAGAGGDEPLAATVTGGLSNEDLVAAAVPVFAAALGIPAPERVLVDAKPRTVRVLDLHAAALVAVLRSAKARGPVRVSVGNVLDELLSHEERFWQGTAVREGLLGGPTGMDAGALRQIVAAGTLLGAASRDQGIELLGRVPGVAASAAVARWLRDLYPPESDATGESTAEWLGSLRPDRLAERLVVAQLAASTELAERCLSGLDQRQALRAVALLGRAAADQQEAAEAALEPVLPLLERMVAGLPADLGLLTAIADAIPYPSAALAEANLTVTRRILEILPAGDLEPRGRWLDWLGVTLAQTGRTAEALPPAQEAVEIRRELAAANPDRYRPDLAASLSNLGVWLSALGRMAEALPVTQEAVKIRRELGGAYPEQYRSHQATSLSNLALWLSALGRPAEALPPAQEAVEIRREQAAAYADRYRPDLAASLINLGVMLSALGRPAEALPPAREAVEAYQELAAAYPDRYRPELARSLSNLGRSLSALGRPTEALPPAREAVGAYRELAAAYPDRYRPDLAASLSDFGVLLSR